MNYLRFPILALLLLFSAQPASAGDVLDSLSDRLNSEADPASKMELHRLLAEEYAQRNDLKSAIQHYHLAIGLADPAMDGMRLGQMLDKLAGIYNRLGGTDRALEYELQALKCFQRLDDKWRAAVITNNIGNIYLQIRDLPSAREEFGRAIQLGQEAGHELLVRSAQGNLAMVHEDMGDYDLALSANLLVLSWFQEEGDSVRVAIACNNLGSNYTLKGELDQALAYYRRSLAISRVQEPEWGTAITIGNIGEIFARRNQADSAKKYLHLALELAARHQDVFTMDRNYDRLAELSAQIGEYKEAVEYLRKHELLNDSLINARSAERMSNLRVIYEVETLQSELELRDSQLLLKEAETESARNRILVLVLICGCLVLGIAVMYYRSRQRNLLHERNRVENEKETLRLQAERRELTREVEFKNRELTSATMQMFQKNEMLREIKEKLQAYKEREKAGSSLREVDQLLDKNLNMDASWEIVMNHFEEVHPGFFNQVKARFPALSQTDLRHLAYMRMNLSTKEIAELMNVTPAAVQKSRVRLKKKMGLGAGQDLRDFVLSFPGDGMSQV